MGADTPSAGSSFVPLVEVTRGSKVESLHRGALAVVDSAGRLRASAGNPKEAVFVRSSAKPFQALALVCSGAAGALGVTEEELAVVCASHSGEPAHTELVASLLRRAGLEEKHLLCGVHSPFDPGTRRALLMAGQEAGALHNNCSGKHAAMLVTASYLGLSLEDYVNPDHDVQVAIRGLIAYLSGVSPEEIGVAVDGCTAPAYQIPLRGFALAMARLAAVGEGVGVAGEARRDAHGREENGEDEEEWTAFEPDTDDDEGFPVSIGTGLRQVWRAMKNHPVLVAGTRGRICTDLMRMAARCGVPLVAKSGAEGFYAWAAVHRGQAIGFASKIEDGAERARNTVLLETLFQLEVLPPEAEGPLASYHRPKVLNLRQQPVGELRPRFRLSRGLA